MSGSPKISKNKILANKEYSKILEDDSYLIKSSKNISQQHNRSDLLEYDRVNKRKKNRQYKIQLQNSMYVQIDEEIGSSSEKKFSRRINKSSSLSYSQRIAKQFDAQDANQKSSTILAEQLKKIRQKLFEYNQILTAKLDKYQLVQFTAKGMKKNNQPQKQYQILKSKVQNNQVFISMQQKQLRQIIQKDRQLEDNDYLIQLEQSISMILKDIKQKKKQNSQQVTNVQRFENKLRDIGDSDQFKNGKVTKQKILYYYKKFRQNSSIIQDLTQKYKKLMKKDQQLTKKYTNCLKLAEQKNLFVKANKNYIQNKKLKDQLYQKIDKMKKNIEINKKSKETEQQKLQKQIEYYRKQIEDTKISIQKNSKNNEQIMRQTNEYIDKSKISKMMIKKISYRFLDFSSPKNLYNSRTLTLQQTQTDQMNRKMSLRPNIKLSKQGSILKGSNNATFRYQTLNIEQTQTKRQRLENKNIESLQLDSLKNKQYRIKPGVNLKRRTDRSQLSQQLELNNDNIVSHINNQADFNYKPRNFQQVYSMRKDKSYN